MEERSVSLTNTSVTFFLFYFIHDKDNNLWLNPNLFYKKTFNLTIPSRVRACENKI